MSDSTISLHSEGVDDNLDKITVNYNEIIEQVRDGEKSYIARLYMEIRKPIFLFILSIVEDYHMAEDLLHETFIKIMLNIDKYKKGTNAKAWMLSIARNVSLNYIKKAKFEEIKDEIVINTSNHMETEVESIMQFASMIEPLDDLEKQIVILRIDGDLPYSQIAKILDISIINARAKYSRALKKLKFVHLK